jgi:urease beta subunit
MNTTMTIDDIKNKIQYGDYNTLGQMLDVPSVTARSRFERGDEEAKDALEKIISARESLIKEHKENKANS